MLEPLVDGFDTISKITVTHISHISREGNPEKAENLANVIPLSIQCPVARLL